jgi:translation initiation factor IF-2
MSRNDPRDSRFPVVPSEHGDHRGAPAGATAAARQLAEEGMERAERDAARRARRRAADEVAERMDREAERRRAERETRETAEREARADRERERRYATVRARRAASADVRRLERERSSALDDLQREAAKGYHSTGHEGAICEAEQHLDRIERELRRANAAVTYLMNFSA